MSADISWDQCVSTVQCCFTSTETIKLVRSDNPGRPPRLSHSSWTMAELVWFSVALRPQRRVGLLGTGTGWEGGERVKGSTAETARKRPERPWTASRTMEVLRRCPLAIAQRLVDCAIAVSAAVLDWVTKTMSIALLLTNNLDNPKQKTSNLLSPAPPPYSRSLLGKCEGPAPPPSSKISWSFDLAWNPVAELLMSWCLMSSDVIWHIRDKLWPMPKHGSIILYVHGNQKAR